MGLSLLAESWTWYAVVTLVVCFRMTSRIIFLGSPKNLQAEDYVMVFVICVYTVLVVTMNIVVHRDTNLMEPEDIPKLTPESIKDRIYGSKMVLVVEQCMIATVWGCKICLLLFYRKLTVDLAQQLAVKFVAAYVVLGFFVMEILYFAVWCRPFHGYWAVPEPNTQCSAATHHLITNAVFNISSDIMMLCIPLPILVTSKLPRPKKIVLCVLFSLGIFVILSAVLNKYYSFAHPYAPNWTFWYIREASTAILVANIPNCWFLIRRIFKLHSWNGTTDGANRYASSRSRVMHTLRRATGRGHGSTVENSNRRSRRESRRIHKVSTVTKFANKFMGEEGTMWLDSQSDLERGVRSQALSTKKSQDSVEMGRRPKELEIWQTVHYQNSTEPADEVKDDRESRDSSRPPSVSSHYQPTTTTTVTSACPWEKS